MDLFDLFDASDPYEDLDADLLDRLRAERKPKLTEHERLLIRARVLGGDYAGVPGWRKEGIQKAFQNVLDSSPCATRDALIQAFDEAYTAARRARLRQVVG